MTRSEKLDETPDEQFARLDHEIIIGKATATIFAELTTDGVTDPAELKRLVLEAWPLWHAPLVEDSVPQQQATLVQDAAPAAI